MSIARNLAIVAAAGLGFVPVTARAQWYSSYPPAAAAYADGAQPYAVEVAPGTYVIHRQRAPHRHAARGRADHVVREKVHPRRTRNDPAMIDALRKQAHTKRHVEKKIVRGKTTIVREKPVVVVHKRVVNDQRVILRRHVVTDLPQGRGLFQPPPQQIVQDLPPVVIPPRRTASIDLPPAWHHEPSHIERHRSRHAEREAAPSQKHKAARRADRHAAERQTARHATVVAAGGSGGKRTIRAEAVVTIQGPDRMTIRLFRKGDAEAAARAD